MSSKSTPLQVVRDRFGSKEKLLDAVVDLLSLPRSERDVTRERLRVAANSKLLRLHTVASEIKERFGGKDKLADAVLTHMGHPKDEDRKEKLMSYGPARLLAMHRKYEPKTQEKEAVEKKKAEKKAEKKKMAKKKTVKKTTGKKTAGKKKAGKKTTARKKTTRKKKA